jgi:hypothetical protein
MKTYTINSIEECNRLIQAFIQKGYHLWQFQYRWNLPEGFIAWFFNGKYDVEVHTQDERVQETLIKSF